jgi:hypothetical protein
MPCFLCVQQMVSDFVPVFLKAGVRDYTFLVSMSHAGVVFRALRPTKRVHGVSRIPSLF